VDTDGADKQKDYNTDKKNETWTKRIKCGQKKTTKRIKCGQEE
jgi:hypothetical protein